MKYIEQIKSILDEIKILSLDKILVKNISKERREVLEYIKLKLEEKVEI